MENWIKTNREALGLSRAELAKAVGAGASTVATWEQGRRPPSPELWSRLAAFYRGHGLEAPDPPKRLEVVRTDREMSKLELKRRECGLTREEVAKAVGVNNKTVVSAWENGSHKPAERFIPRLAALFRCTPEEIGFSYREDGIRNGMTVEERNTLASEYIDRLTRFVFRVNKMKFLACCACLEDMRQEMALALIEAANRYDKKRGDFGSYAIKWMEKEARTAASREYARGIVHPEDGFNGFISLDKFFDEYGSDKTGVFGYHLDHYFFDD